MRAIAFPLLLATSLPAQEATARPADLTATFGRIDPLVQPLLGKVTVGLVVGVTRDGKSGTRGHGRIDPQGDTVPNGDTVYEIGSITKVFTGILLADAVTRGLVGLDEPVQKHLPESVAVPGFAGKPIHLVHLSTHTSGLPRMPGNFRPRHRKDPFADYDAQDLHDGLTSTKLSRVPGRKYVYSNFAVGLLGHVLQTVQNRESYEALVLERICIPLALSDTRLTLTESMRERLAPPHNAAGRRTSNWTFDSLAGCGALRSTANDLLRFAGAMLEPESLAGKRGHLRSAVELAMKVHHRPQSAKRRAGQPTLGLGWHFAGKNVVWHNGGTAGYRTHLRVDTLQKTVVVVLANTTSRRVDALAARIATIL